MASRVALVTGSSGGLGRSIAVRLAEAGVTVAVTARRDQNYPGTVEETKALIERTGGTALTYDCDLSRADERAELVGRVQADLGEIDILVNNAAVSHMEPLASFPMKRLDLMLDVQVRAPMILAQGVIPGMKRRGAGWIVNITSPAAIHPEPTDGLEWSRNTVYGMCKAAVERFTTGLAAELYDDGINVNALAPRTMVKTFGAAAFFDVNAHETEPPELIAEAVAQLTDPDAPRVTGGIFYTDAAPTGPAYSEGHALVRQH
jgi:NAD(P)-dependent dehydrogenase (short-subunit alcohol dehydrogenase family)